MIRLALLLFPLLAQTPAQVPGIAVERRLAAQLGLSVGDTVRIGRAPDSLRVVGIVAAVFEPRPDPADIPRPMRRLRMHLPDLAEVLGTPDRVDRFGVALRPGVSPDTAAAVLDRNAIGYQAFSIVASAVFLLCIMLLKVEERRMDAAVMRFIGVRRRTIFGALVLEAALVAVAGSAAGTVFAVLASAATNAYYRRFFDTTLTFSVVTPGIIAFCVALSLALGLIAGAAAAARLARTRPMVLWGRG